MTTIDEVRRIAKLSRLSFKDNELGDIATQLTNIMQMIDTLKEVDCSRVEPLTSVSGMQQRMRKDEVLSYDITDQLFVNISGNNKKLAEEVKCFIVPKVME